MAEERRYTKNPTRALLWDWLEALEDPSAPLTDWEEKFLQSCRDALDKGHSLSHRQREILEDLYADKTP